MLSRCFVVDQGASIDKLSLTPPPENLSAKTWRKHLRAGATNFALAEEHRRSPGSRRSQLSCESVFGIAEYSWYVFKEVLIPSPACS